MSIVDQSTAVSASSLGIALTSGAGTNTLGSFVEMIASTSAETYWYQVVMTGNVGVADEDFIVEIALGAASSEVVFCRFPVFTNFLGPITIPPMPKTIASGSRVSMRVQSTAASKAIEAMIYLSDNDEFGKSTEQEDIGVVTAASKGTDVDSGGTNNTYGSYVELSSSISIDANYVVLFWSNSDNNGQSNLSFLYSVASGAASSEVDKLIDIPFSQSSFEIQSNAYGFFQSFSSSDRIAAKTQCSNTSDSNDRITDVSMILFNIIAPTGGSGGIAQIVGQGGIVG